MVLIVRKQLDDASTTVTSAAIHCLRGLICNTELDELFLDRTFTWNHNQTTISHLEPQLDTKKVELNELTDEDLVRIDPIRALIRSDLLIRLRYLIDNYLKDQDDPIVIKNVFDILTRIGRHSTHAVRAIAECPYLLESIVTNFLKPHLTADTSSVSANPHPAALKLLRVMFQADTTLITQALRQFPDLLRTFQILVTIEPSFFTENDRKFAVHDALKLAIESVRVWTVLLSSNEQIVVAALLSLFPSLIRQAQYLCTLSCCTASAASTFDWQYGACLIACLTGLIERDPSARTGLTGVIQSALFHWINEAVNFNSPPPSVDVINAVAQAITCVVDATRAHAQQAAQDLALVRDNVLARLINCDQLWARLTDWLVDCSSVINFHSDCVGKLRESSTLPSFGALAFGQRDGTRVCPVLKDSSTMPLVHSVIRALLTMPGNEDIAERLLAHEKTLSYVARVIDSENWSSGARNVFEYHEYLMLADMCTLSKSCPQLAAHYLPVTVSLVSCIKEKHTKHRLLNEVVFDRAQYGHGLREQLAALTLEEHSSLADKALDQLAATQLIYQTWSDVDGALWVFDPIVNHVKVQEADKDIDAVRKCLYFIVLLKQHCPQYFRKCLDTQIEFCLIATVFVAGNDFFFDQDVAAALKACLSYFSERQLKLDAKTKLPHFVNVGELYAQLTDQYHAVSYNDKLFKSYLDVFAQMKS